MALKRATQIVAQQVVPSADAATDVIAIFGDYTTVAGLAADDVIEMCPLPAGYVPVDVMADVEQIDSDGSPTITLDCGLLSGAFGSTDSARTCAATFISASTVAQAGGIARMSAAGGGRIAPTTADRGVGFKVSAAIATLVVGAKLRLTLRARPQSESV